MSFYDPAEFCPVCCEWMGRPRSRGSHATIDHFIPRALGGPDLAWNWWVICHRCNVTKGGRLPNDRETRLFNRQKGFV